MPIKVTLWLVYVVGDCILRLLCNVVGIVVPVLLISIVYLAMNHNWISIGILLGMVAIVIIFLVLLSRLVYGIGNFCSEEKE